MSVTARATPGSQRSPRCAGPGPSSSVHTEERTSRRGRRANPVLGWSPTRPPRPQSPPHTEHRSCACSGRPAPPPLPTASCLNARVTGRLQNQKLGTCCRHRPQQIQSVHRSALDGSLLVGKISPLLPELLPHHLLPPPSPTSSSQQKAFMRPNRPFHMQIPRCLPPCTCECGFYTESPGARR